MTYAEQAYPLVLLALAVWREARGGTYNEKLGVAYVIRNRVADKLGRWPVNLPAVVTQPRQFSAFNAGDPNATKFPASSDASWEESCRATADALNGAPDPTRGANHYHALPASEASSWPSWADPNRQTAMFGMTRFYKL
jgi:N-acetylmuramoyl-L-alanine amidase